jgi:CBS domain-containing protein
MNAADVMTTAVITASPSTPVAELARLMLENRVSGLPVVEGGLVVGIVSEGDLVRRLAPASPRGLLAAFLSRAAAATAYIHENGNLAADVMTAEVISVSPETPVAEIAETMDRCGIKRMPVLDDAGAMVGIVTRANLLRALAGHVLAPPVSDREIRRDLVTALGETGWSSALDPSGVIVGDGVVHLWGPVSDATLRRALIVAAENTQGVRAVVDHMTIED